MTIKSLSALVGQWLDGTAARRLPQSVISALIDTLAADEPETADTSAIIDSCGYSAT